MSSLERTAIKGRFRKLERFANDETLDGAGGSLAWATGLRRVALNASTPYSPHNTYSKLTTDVAPTV
jgi:hypothetical protein